MQEANLPFITIGLPFYNNEKTLLDAIKSVLIQSYTNWELILLDDGSTDDSNRIASDIAQKDSRIRLIRDKENKGLIFRLNQIIDLSSGEFIARMDADDMMMPYRLEKQIRLLLSDPIIDVVDCAMYTIDDLNRPVGKRGLNKIDGLDREAALKGALLNHPTVVAKSSWYRKNRYSEEFIRAEDYELWCRTFMQTRFERVLEPLMLYREGKVNIKNYQRSMRTVRKILKVYGPAIITKPNLMMEVGRTHIKSLIYTIVGFCGLQDHLSSKRNISLSAKEKYLIDEIVLLIKNS